MEFKLSDAFPDLPQLDKKCFFYDEQLKLVVKYVKELNDVVKQIDKRFERRDTLQISSSIAQYFELKNDVAKYPYVLYKFIDNDTKICVIYEKNNYHVYSNPFNPCIAGTPLAEKSELGKPYYYGDFKYLADAVEFYHDVIRDYLYFPVDTLEEPI